MDHRSVGGFILTMTGTILTDITKSNTLFWVTVLAGASTVIYNAWRIYRDWKKNL